jgi:hypothetical protein
MADTDYMGGIRHVAKPSFSPMGQSDVGGTSSILNAAGRSKPGKSAPASMPRAGTLGGPLRLSSAAEIIGASKLGQRPPDQKTPGEQMSDADAPNQAVEKLPDGTFVHHRRNPATGNTLSTRIGSGRSPLDDYEHLNYDSMPANVGELQQRLGIATKSLFGNEA